jgi:hypothetical protein
MDHHYVPQFYLRQAGSMRLDVDACWADSIYVFLYPEDNEACRAAAHLYGEYLTDATTFQELTLERLVAAIQAETDATWIDDVRDRYLGWSKVEQVLARKRVADG